LRSLPVSRDTLKAVAVYQRPDSATVIALIAGTTHLYSLIVFGAVFWIDAAAYAGLGESLKSAEGLGGFYPGVGTWFYSHLQPGLALVWLGLELVPTTWQWPVLAVLQHALAGYALYEFFLTVHRRWPSRWNFLGCAFVGCLPFYQAAHNSFMTESISSSLLLIGLALALRISGEPAFAGRRLLALLAIVIAVTQFRSYLGLLLAGASAVLISGTKVPNRRVLALLCVAVMVGSLAFPVYRFSVTGHFWLPQLGVNKLQAGWWVNPVPTDRALEELRSFDFPEKLSPENTVNKGLDYDEATVVALHWRNAGLSDLEINSKAAAAGAVLANDSAKILLYRALQALTSSGMVLPYCLLEPTIIVFPGYTAQRLCDHMQAVYQFHSWLAHQNYRPQLESFFRTPPWQGPFSIPFGRIASEKLLRQSENYVTGTSLQLRDPLRLGKLPPDMLVLVAMAAMVASLLSDRRLFALACLVVILGNAAVSFAAPLGNPRYGYVLFPIYAAFVCFAITGLNRWLKNRLVHRTAHQEQV
jgi:hypothetical protein